MADIRKIKQNQDDIEAIDIIIKNVLMAIEKNIINRDKTYKSSIKSVTPKGYIIADDTGTDRTVKCCIPNLELKVGQSVWIKEPMGDLNGIHICGVV